MQKILFLILVHLSLNSSANTDTLYTYFLNESNPIEKRFTALNHFAFYSIFSNPDTGRYYNDMSIEFAKKEQNYQWLSFAYNTRGVFYQYTGDIMNALDCYLRCLKINEYRNDSAAMCTSYLNLGALYIGLGDFKIAKEYNDKGIIYAEALNLKTNMANGYNNAASVAEEVGNEMEAIENFKKCIPLFIETNNFMNLSNVQSNIGRTFSKLGMVDSALYYFDQSLKIRKELEFYSGQADILFELGNIELASGNFGKARALCNESRDLAVMSGDPSIEMQACQCLFSANEGVQNWKEASINLKRYYELRDSTKGTEILREAIETDAAFRYEKKKISDSLAFEKERSISQAELVARDAEIRQQETVEYSMYGGLAGLALFAFFIFNRFQASKKQNKIIAEQKEKVDIAYSELEEKNGEIMDSITYAKRIQNAILPPARSIKEHLPESFVLYKPKDVVSGDFYWLEKVGNHIIFAIGDCTGHGVPGAMVSVVCHNALNRSVREFMLNDPGKILDKTRELVIEQFEKSDDDVKDGMDIALCTLEKNKLHFAGAHSPLWLLRKNSEVIEEIKANKQPIGKFANATSFQTTSIDINPGDQIYLFSDGYADQFGGEKGKKFKTSNFKTLLLSLQSETLNRQQEIIDNAFTTWRGELEQVDDICVIGVRF